MRHHFLLFLLSLSSLAVSAKQVTAIANLKVEYQTTPMAVEEAQPRFSWQMTADKSARNCFQKAYAIEVKDLQGNTLWNSGKVNQAQSLNVRYEGKSLKPQTRYNWQVTVWNQDGDTSVAQSWFETGLESKAHSMDAWKGAKWISVPESGNVLYAQYLPVFRWGITMQMDKKTKTTKAAFLLGVNDQRLMDANKNIYHLHNQPGDSYVKVELNASGLKKNQPATLAIYRVGYTAQDAADQPLKTIPLPTECLNLSNRYLPHRVEVAVNLGNTELFFDGKNVGKVALNPIGQGGDFLAFPVLAEVGTSVEKGQVVTYSDAQVKAFRSPSQVIASVESLDGCLDGRKMAQRKIIDPSRKSMPMLRTQFDIRKKVASARLYVTARGVYDAYLNGCRINPEYLNPGLTQYNKTHLYQTYDVTTSLRQGKNAMGAILGEGWWSGGLTFQGENWNFFGDRQSLLAMLHVQYQDGSEEDIVSNPDTWQCYADGPVVYGSLFQGEVYDASKEDAVRGWTLPSYDAKDWESCVEMPLTGHVAHTGWGTAMAPDDYSDFRLRGQQTHGILPVKELTAQSVKEVRKGVFVYDMGQNMVGVPKILMEGLAPSTHICLRYAEVLYPHLPEYKGNEGMIMLENIRAAMAQDIYVAKGGKETFSPRFTYHGYRYVEITGIDAPLPLESVKGVVLSSIHELSSHYQCSNAKVNRLWENVKWSSLGNFFSVPTDCPQRNERMGWAGDISVFSRTASYMTDASQFLRNYLQAMRDVQTPEGRFQDIAPVGGGFGGLLWGSAGITVPWECYQQYNDTALLVEHYEAMKRYLAYVKNHYMDPATGVIVQNHQWGDLGDWLGLEDERNDKSLLWESYYIYDLELMQKMAQVLGRQEDADDYARQKQARIDFFHATYIDAQTGKTVASSFLPERKGKWVDTQTSYVLPLAFGIIKPELREKFIANFKATLLRHNRTDGGVDCPPYSLMTGFIGTAWVSKALSDHGCDGMAYRLLRQESYPSWLYPVTQGATTVWERLNSYTHENGFGGNNRMNSFNHYSFGAVVAWMYNYSLGIQRDESHPGFQHFLLCPVPDEADGLQSAEGFYDSMYGRIESSWKREGDRITYNFVIPANTSATVRLGRKLVKELPSGSYQFIVKADQ